jgi:hypothetical protein
MSHIYLYIIIKKKINIYKYIKILKLKYIKIKYMTPVICKDIIIIIIIKFIFDSYEASSSNILYVTSCVHTVYTHT